MKRFTTIIITKIKKLYANELLRYTVVFFMLICSLYIFSLFAGMLSSPGFTYAEF